MALAAGSNSSACGVVIDRHVPKNAGTTVRTLLRGNQKLGACEYIGYDVTRTWASRVGFNHRMWTGIVNELHEAPSRRRLCVEAHTVGEHFWRELSRLRLSPFAHSCRVQVLLRVREPLSWYRSFFDWAIVKRQRSGQFGDVFGANFTDWLPHNLQSEYLLHGAEGEGPSRPTKEMAKRPPPSEPRRLPAERWARAQKVLRSADIVAPVDRLDDAVALLVHRAGFLATSAHTRQRPRDTTGAWARSQPVRVQRASTLCGGVADEYGPVITLGACVAAVRAAAPDDARLYALGVKMFERQWARHRSRSRAEATRRARGEGTVGW